MIFQPPTQSIIDHSIVLHKHDEIDIGLNLAFHLLGEDKKHGVLLPFGRKITTLKNVIINF